MNYKILIADDKGDSFEYLQEILKDEVDRFEIIRSGRKDIYTCALKSNPNIILINIDSLARNGIESIMSLKQDKLTHAVPVLLITDYSPRTSFDRVFEYGVVDFIRKPYDKDELLMRIEAAESRREFQHEIYIEHELLRELSIVAKKTATGVAIISTDNRIEWVNEGFERMYGYSIDEFKDTFEKSIFNPKSNPKLAEAIEKCQQGADSYVYEKKWETKEGKVIWIQTTLTPVYNEQDTIIKYIAIESNVTDLKQAEERLGAQNEEIAKQKKKSDELLLNILPFETAEQLKKKGFAKSKQYKLVSILFTDFKDFSRLTNQLNSQELVEQLNFYIQKFDEIIENHFIEKIKTIGDAYMCAGGLPLRNKSNPINVTLAGLQIQKFMRDQAEEKEKNNEKAWELRLGIHTGEVIAGVIGKKKFAYDIWGDAVNKASRMEQSGEVGKVNVSGDTYEYIKDYFDCTYRGQVEVKNNVQLEMYFVDRLKPEYSEDKEGTVPNAEFLKKLAKY